MVKRQTQFEVEEIRDKQMRSGRLEYLVKWKNYPDSQNTWEPRKHLKGCYTLIHDFEKRRKEKSRADLVSMQLEELLEKSDDYWEKRKETETQPAKSEVPKRVYESLVSAAADSEPAKIEQKPSRSKRMPVFQVHKSATSLHLETWFLIAPLRKGEVVGCYRDESGEVLVEVAEDEDHMSLLLLDDAAQTKTRALVQHLLERIQSD